MTAHAYFNGRYIGDVASVRIGELPVATHGERLLEEARDMKQPRGILILAEGQWVPSDLARAATALKFLRAPSVTHLRSIVEGWSMARIVRELY